MKKLSELLTELADFPKRDGTFFIEIRYDRLADLIRQAVSMETELQERREEINNLETELAATKAALATEAAEADKWARKASNGERYPNE